MNPWPITLGLAVCVGIAILLDHVWADDTRARDLETCRAELALATDLDAAMVEGVATCTITLQRARRVLETQCTEETSR